MRSGDRPPGNAAASDQPSAAAKIIGDPENNGADVANGPAAAVPPAGATGAGEGANEQEPAPGRDETANGERPASGDNRDVSLKSGESRTDTPNSARGDAGPEPKEASFETGDGSSEAREASSETGDGSSETGDGSSEARTAAPRPKASRVGAARLWPRTRFGARTGLGARTRLSGWRRRSGQRPDRQPKYPDAGGAAFARLTVLPAVLMAAWLLVGLPLLLAGVLLPTPMVLVAVPLAVLLTAGLQRMPARWPRALPGAAPAAAPAGRRRKRGWGAWWGLAGTVVIAGGFAFWQFLFNSESVIVLRDPGAYLQTGYWLAQHGSLPIPQSLAAFGGAHPGLVFASTGFSVHGTSVVPGLMSGLPLLLAGAFWVHGTSTAAAMGPILGGVAVLAFGGLVGRLAGPQWAPAGALVLACTLPEQYTSRASFSETAAQVLLFGGLSLVVDALTLARKRTQAAASAAAGGLEAPPPSPETRPLPAAADPSSAAADPSSAAADPSSAAADLSSAAADLSSSTAQAASSAATDSSSPAHPPSSAGGWQRRFRRLSPGRDRAPEWALMALGGLTLGLTSLVRFDGLLDVLPAIPFIGLLVVRRDSSAIPFCGGLAVGTAYGLADAYLLARPFVNSLQPMPELIGLIAAWLLAMTVAGVELMRLPGFRGGLRPVLARRPVRWLPDLCAILAVAAIVALAIRPYLQTVRGSATGATAAFVASLQRLEHLPVNPGRLYAEDTLYWVIWYVGLPAVLLGGFGLALLVRRCLRALFSWHDPFGAARVWALPLAVISCGSAAVLWQPETVPDQPWASRRLVPLVLPGLILCAIWASAWFRGRGRTRGASKTAASVVAAFCVAALLVPTLATNLGLALNHADKHRALQLASGGLAFKRTGPGEVGAVTRMCALLGPSPSVVIVAPLVAQQFTQVIRGMCGVPTASMIGQPVDAVQNVLASIEHAGRRPVLLGGRPTQLYAYGGGSPVRVLDLSTSQDPHTLTQPPTTLSPADFVIWMSSVVPVGSRV